MTEQHIEIKLPDLSRVALEPGDKILVRHPKRISNSAAREIGAHLKKAFPANEVMIMDDGLELAIVRPVEAGPDLANRLEAIADELAEDTKNKGIAAGRAILFLRNEVDTLREAAS